jgi:SAM-dependent methyltransferase
VTDRPAVLRPEVGEAFQFRGVASAYRHRPTYPPAVFDVLMDLIAGEPRAVLDLGCGTGNVARPLAPLVDRVEAIDVSVAMIEEGKRLPGGDHPRLTWIVGRAEDAPLRPPYALVTAGGSLHWMDWDVLLPRLHDALAPGGRLAIVDVEARPASGDRAWEGEVLELIKRYTTVKEWTPGFDLVAVLERRGLFREQGRTQTAPEPFRQSLDEYVESFHSRATLTRERMGPDDAAAFDAAVRQLVLERVGDEVEFEIVGEVIWGRPVRP